MRVIKYWKDFGKEGVPASALMLDYRENRTYNLSEPAKTGLTNLWTDSLKEAQEKGANLTNGRLMNLLGVYSVDKGETTLLSLGPSQFMDYDGMGKIYDHKKVGGIETSPARYSLSGDDARQLRENIHVLSSFPAVISGGCVIMGKKGKQVTKEGAGKISFPGAGYLNPDKETFTHEGALYTRQPQQIISREIKEEMKIYPMEIEEAAILAIAEDDFKGSHRNPGMMSLVKSKIGLDEIRERKGIVEDAWEHEGPYLFVPIENQELYEAYIDSDLGLEANTIPEVHAKKIEGLGNIRKIDTTGKSQIMLFLLGRYQFGQSWYEEMLEKYKDKLKIVPFSE